MNTDKRNLIKKMVQSARALLIQEARESLEGTFGLHAHGSFEDISSLPELKDADKQETRKQLENFFREEAKTGFKGKEAVDKLVKEIAFTHLNRFVAFKMMEAKKIIRQTISRGADSNAFKFYLVDNPEDERRYNEGKIDEAYRNFLLWQSGELAKEIKVLFDPENLPSRLFPRPRVLKELFDLLNDETIMDIWQEDETIGWVYQYFIEADKDRVFNKIYTQKKKMDLRDIPSATQIFTPKWIVRYLVENTLGRLWLRMHPDSTLMGTMKYYVPNDNDKQTIPMKPVREITLLDPACGTMHFGMVAFDLFYEMYLEEMKNAGRDGWPGQPSLNDKEQVPASIIENNLYGIDLDLRAIQLSALSLFIKARSKNGGVTIKKLNLTCTDIPEFSEATINTFIDGLDTSHDVTKKLLKEILPVLNKAYYLGSLLKIETVVSDFVDREKVALGYRRQGSLPGLEKRAEQLEFDLFTERKIAWDKVSQEIHTAFHSFLASHKGAEGAFVANESMKGLNLIDALIKKHDVVVCNPPYSGRRNMKEVIRNDLTKLYPRKAGDLYTVFIDRCLDLISEDYGFCGMVTIHSFMFTSSHEEIRKEIINNTEIETMAHLGTRAEFDVANKTAQGFSMYSLGKVPGVQGDTKSGIYFRLVKENEEEKHTAFCNALEDYLDNRDSFSDLHVFVLQQEKLKAIPGWPFVYWVSDRLLNIFQTFKPLSTYAKACTGLSTGDNFRFLRLWWEAGTSLIKYNCKSLLETEDGFFKWFPCMKGGSFNRWYGNQEYIVNWYKNGFEIKNNYHKNGRLVARPQNQKYYFKQGITYTYLTISDLNLRLLPYGFICDHAGNGIFPNSDEYVLQYLGILNSKLSIFILNLLNPTVHKEVGDISRIPFPLDNANREISPHVISCIKLKKELIITNETSWDFVAPQSWNSGIFDKLKVEKGLVVIEAKISESVYKLYEISDIDIEQIESEFGTLTGKFPKVDDLTDPRLQIIERLYLEKHVPDEVIRQSSQKIDDDDPVVEPSKGRGRRKRFLTFEELCLASGFHPDTVCGYIVQNRLERQEERYELAVQWVSYATGVVLGRFKPGRKGELGSGIDEDGEVLIDADFEKLNKLVDDDGIMVLDPGHPDDLPARVEEALTVLLGEKDCKDVISVLGGDLRKFFEREFFTKWHIPMYRKRPVYWLLQSAKKSYGIYLFHERLTGDSLFLIREKYVEPKISLEKNHLAELKGRLFDLPEGKDKRTLEKEIEKLEIFIDELAEFQKNIRGVSDMGYDPDINDGVILNMAPLHEIIPWSEPKKYWQELKDEKYDWAHIAMKYWPERVREKCKTDKSLMIAHGLEM